MIPDLATTSFTLISDRDKGLLACDNQFPFAFRAFCCQHIAANIQEKFGIKSRDMFWRLAKARTASAYDKVMDELKKEKPSTIEYLKTIPARMWARYLFAGPRYGFLTSNIVESANATYKEERGLPVIDMLIGIYHKEMHRHFLRHQAATQLSATQRFTPWAQALLRESLSFAGRNKVLMATGSNTKSHVTQIPDRQIFLVDLTASTCSCIRYQDTGIPCGHAVATIYHLKARAPIDYMPETLSRGNWVETYKADMAPFDYECFNRLTKLDPNSLHPEVEDVGENENELQPCKPPLTKIPRGRPAKKRVQKGDVRRKGYNPSNGGLSLPDVPNKPPPRCSICKGVGHYAPKCRQPHR
jgi:hypothetical protein